MLEDVELVIEIEDTELIACGDEGDKRAGLAGHGIADGKELGDGAGGMVSEGGH